MDTNKMRSELRVSAERAVANNPPGGDGNPFPALAIRAVDVLALLAEIERLETSRSKKERELEQELEVWHHGPFCWTCGDTGDVHDITGEWRGECDCLSAQLINANRERDQLKAENEDYRSGQERYEQIIEDLKVESEKMRSFLAEVSRTSGDKWAVMAARNLLKEFGHD